MLTTSFLIMFSNHIMADIATKKDCYSKPALDFYCRLVDSCMTSVVLYAVSFYFNIGTRSKWMSNEYVFLCLLQLFISIISTNYKSL